MVEMKIDEPIAFDPSFREMAHFFPKAVVILDTTMLIVHLNADAEKTLECIKTTLRAREIQTLIYPVNGGDDTHTFEARFKDSGEHEVTKHDGYNPADPEKKDSDHRR